MTQTRVSSGTDSLGPFSKGLGETRLIRGEDPSKPEGGGGFSELGWLVSHPFFSLAADVSVDDLVRYESAVRKLDLARTESGLPEDRTRILSEVKASAGIKAMQGSVQVGVGEG